MWKEQRDTNLISEDECNFLIIVVTFWAKIQSLRLMWVTYHLWVKAGESFQYQLGSLDLKEGRLLLIKLFYILVPLYFRDTIISKLKDKKITKIEYLNT